MTVSVMVSGIRGFATIPSWTQFKVFAPTVEDPTAKQGSVKLSPSIAVVALMGAVNGPLGDGMYFNANVSVPVGPGLDFKEGVWQYVQTETRYRHQARTDGNGAIPVNEHQRNSGAFGLDNFFPYDKPSSDQPWDTGPIPHPMTDNPNNLLFPSLNDPRKTDTILSSTMNNSFTMFIMFKPAGDLSQWVPLVVDHWTVAFDVGFTGPGAYPNSYKINSSNASNGGFVPATDEPLWQMVLHNGDGWVPE